MDKKQIAVVLTGAALIYFLMKSKTIFAAPTKDAILRNCDPLGCGNFGASRSGGTRKHSGIDFKALPGQVIVSPIAGTVTRFPRPYADDARYSGIEIKNETYLVKMFYIAPEVNINAKVKRGQRIAIAQNISAKHGAAMVNHVHFEVYDVKTGKLLDPTALIPGASLNKNFLLYNGLMDSPEVAELQRLLGLPVADIDGDFGPKTEAALLKAKGVKQITLKAF